MIKITRYTSSSYGVKAHANGSLLKREDVAEVLIHILDNDELVRERVLAFLDELQDDK